MKHMFITVCTVAVCMVSMLLLGGCSSEPTKNTTTQQQDTSWYPLAVGNTWIYRNVRSGGGAEIVGYDTTRIIGTRSIKGKQYFILRYTSNNSTEVSTSYTRLRGNDTLVSYRIPSRDPKKDSVECIDFVFSQDTSSQYISYDEQGSSAPRRTVSRNDTLTVSGVHYTNVLVLESGSPTEAQIRFYFRRGVGFISYLFLSSPPSRSVYNETSLVSFRSASNF